MNFFLFLLAVFFSAFSYSQTPDFTWQKTIGGDLSDELTTVLLTNDGGYLLGGTSESNISSEKTDSSKGGKDYWVVKLDSLGHIQWDKTIGGSSEDQLKQVVKSSDGGYLLGGYSDSNISFDKSENSFGLYDYWIVKIDSLGNIQWDKTIGGSENDELNDLVPFSEYGYVLAGNSSSDISGSKTEDTEGGSDFWIVMIDSIGDIHWQNTIGGDTSDYVNSIETTIDGGLILGGDSNSDVSGDKTSPSGGSLDYWIVKLDNTGEIEWDKSIGVEGYSGYSVAFETADGGFQVSGSSACNASGIKTENSYGGIAYWIVKLDSDGILEWENTIGGGGLDYLTSAIPTFDGGSLIAGYSGSSISYDKTEESHEYSFWIVKLNSEGIIEWENTIGGQENDIPKGIIQIDDDRFIIGGTSASNSQYDKHDFTRGGNDYWLLELNPCSTINDSVSIISEGSIEYDLVANAEGYIYQWYECIDNYRVAIPGRNEQGLESETYDMGYFSVIIHDDQDCSVFSDCIYVQNIGLSVSENVDTGITIFPNPATNNIHIEYDSDIRTELLNVNGETVLTDNSTILTLSDLPAGIYLLNVYDTDSNLIGSERVIKQ